MAGSENFSIESEANPGKITLPHALEFVQEKKVEAAKRNKASKVKEAKLIIQDFEDTDIQARHGRYGPFMTGNCKIARVPKSEEATLLTLEERIGMLADAPGRTQVRHEE